MEGIVTHMFYFLIYPGFLFAALLGACLSWFDRKISARVQFRKGPPLLQPIYDFLKFLLVKETILPAKGDKGTFLLAPVFGLFGAIMAAVFVLLPALQISGGFKGDVIVVFYVLTVPSLTYILGAVASANPLAFIGASREVKLLMSYELTFLLVIAAVVLKSGRCIDLGVIVDLQQSGTVFGCSISGLLLFIVSIFCIQAKLGFIPFDVAEAETEINHGTFVEYSGTAYAIIMLTKYILLFILPAFLIALFWGGVRFEGIHIVWSILKLAGIVLLLSLIRNTNPRLKIKQAMRFFFLWMNLLVGIAIVLIYYGF